MVSSFAPSGLVLAFTKRPFSLRCGLHSVAASRLDRAGFRDSALADLRGWDFVHVLLSTAEFREHLGFDVAAGDDRHVQFCFRKLIGAEEESCGGDCAAGLGYCFWIRRQ